MSDGESTTPAPRKRPSYGLPAPTTPAPGGGGAPQQWSPSGQEAPGGDPYGAPAPGGAPTGGPFGGGEVPQTGPLPSTGHLGPARRRRRGVVPLVIGLILLVIVGPVMTIGGIVWSMSSLVPDATSGPTVIDGGTVDLEVPANEMLIVYVPAEDAEAAQCTAEGSGSGDVSTVPSSSTTVFGDGSEYVQVLGVATLQDTTVTISCTGTDGPAYLGPYSLLSMAGPLLIGPIIGVVAGLVGLILTIIGIVLLVRSRRA
ncbi:hypothetical protein [Brachybacterium sp. YJGR34]|uniref:hypothetical protein n=1 Tax=Brachybacterium sp. YJGR34 TaxID=2059911 RepID=UPI000E0C546B|nr:hypothetical protein [Brachybacterium sp. YJGR34]